METREDPHVDLRDTYLVGTRLSKFLSIVLPMHKDFNSPDPELSEMRRKSHAQWLTLTHYLEELALIIDEEEHSQFVLRDLNESGEEEQPVMDVPPELVVGKTKKRHGSKQQPSKNNEFVEENRPHPFPSTVEDNAASANPPQNSFHTASVNQQQHPNNNSNCNYNSILNRGEDPWQTVDATTVASLDTHWFSSAFSEPFPVSTGDEHDKSDRSDRKKATEHALLDEDEQIVQISGSSRSSKSKQQNTFMDTADIPFGNLTLEEEARNLDFFATQMTKPSSEHSFQNAPVVTPIDKRGSSSDNKKNNNAWRIAPAPSDRPLLKQSPLANNNSHIKDDWGSSPFHVDDKPQFSWAEPASSIKQQPSAMDMSPFWDEETAPQPEPRKSSKTSETPANSKQDPGEMLHSKGKVSKRPFSRYMALDEHKKKQSDRQSGKSNNARNSRNSERRPLRHYEQDCGDDTDFDKIGAMLDGNKARARREYNGAPALRQRGIHHMKECVRCLLE